MSSGKVTIPRCLEIDLPRGQSAFLLGPRQTGKSTWLRNRFVDSAFYDFLKTDLFLELSKHPALLREWILALPPSQRQLPIVLDEVQKVPGILNEVHWLIENAGCRFILCGSSARKLRHGQSNLLGGRAWKFKMFPLTTRELKDLDLLTALNRGLLPSHYFSLHPQRSLKAYVEDYLKDEIMAESLVRNLPAFARFLDALGYSMGELVNFSNIARDCAVDAKTVKSYFEILVDTLIGRFIPPFATTTGRQVISAAEKFYLFDVGVAGFLCKRTIAEEKGEAFGRALEHFILMELWAYRGMTEKDFEIRFWRTKTGLEVDFVLGGGQVAVEVKGSRHLGPSDLTGIGAFKSEFSSTKAIVVCTEPQARVHDEILILPWREFCARLWNGTII